MTRLTPILTLALAACHHAAPAAKVGNGSSAAATGDVMAGLFAGDRTLVYDVTSESSFWDDQDPAADANGNVNSKATQAVTCQLTVATIGTYRTATIACAEDADGNSFGSRVLEEFERTFVTDGTRLWRLEAGAMPSTAAELEAALPATPDLVAGQQPVEQGAYGDNSDDDDGDGNPDDGEEDERFGSSHKVSAIDDGWCIADDGWGGDEGGSGWCLSAARGVVSASWYFAGGSSQDQRAELRE